MEFNDLHVYHVIARPTPTNRKAWVVLAAITVPAGRASCAARIEAFAATLHIARDWPPSWKVIYPGQAVRQGNVMPFDAAALPTYPITEAGLA